MKKYCKGAGGYINKLYSWKIFKLMRNTLLLVFITVLQANANDTYSQNTKLTLNFNNVTVANVLEEIQNNSEFYFLFNAKLIDIKREVSISMEDKKIPEILTSLFKGTGVNYLVYDRQIILTPSDVTSLSAAMQQLKITGTVVDKNGSPVPGVNVVVTGTTLGTITDIAGKYSIEVPQGSKSLTFSFIGMEPQVINIGTLAQINVTMTESAIGLDEVVVVGYGTQRRATVTGSIASVQSQQLTISPVSQTSNTLAGRLPGLISYQNQGLPGRDQAALKIRGFGNPLVIVDGVEADLNRLDPSSIESISILKDGAASIYGSRAGNGVILVTTKRGTTDRPIFTLNTSISGQGVTYMPTKVSSGQYAEMSRESWIQSGKPEETAPYSLEDIQKFYAGTDPNFVNTDWRKELIRDWAPMQQHQLSVRGGTDRVKYYGLLGLLEQESMWKTSGGVYKRYNLQSNVDVKLTDNLDLQLNLAGSMEDSDYPYRSQGIATNMIWQDYWGLLPIYRARFPDPTKQPFINIHASIWQLLDKNIGGYDRTKDQRVSGTFVLNYRFKPVKGLSAKGLFNYLKDDSFSATFFKGDDMWNWDPLGDIYTLAASNIGQTAVARSVTYNQNITMQLSLNYDRTFGGHQIKALAVYEMIDYRNDYLSASRSTYVTTAIDQLFAGTGMDNNGNASEMGRTSYIGRLNYSYKDKYLFESIIRADASAKFPPDTRWGYFPSVSLGWRISEESFMDNLGMLDDLKLRASAGQSGNDGVGNFQYLAGYGLRNNYGSWLYGNTQTAGIFSRGLENPNLTWEKITIYNAGFDFTLWKSKLYGEVDVFYRERNGIPATRILSLPSTFGAALPPENINSLNDRGFDLKIGTSDKSGDLTWDISSIISWSRAKAMHYEEPDYTDPDQKRINQRSGLWTDRFFGYLSDGLFTSQEEINNLGFDQDMQGNITLRPGDVRYKDVNGDKVLDWKDQVEIGDGTEPHWMVGFNINLTYKNFDLSTLWQGALGFYKQIGVQGNTIAYYNLRWTPENNNRNALVPRLGGSSLNGATSDYNYKKADYMRLKSASIGYTLPREWTSKINISGVRIYAAGTNLLTLNPFKDYGIDPEAPTGYGASFYPQQRTISLGATVTF